MSFRVRISRAVQALRNRPEEPAAISGIKTLVGEFPTVSFETSRNWFLKDPTVRYHAEYLRDALVGQGFYLRAKNSEAKHNLEGFCEDVNLDGIHQESVLQMIYAGSSFTWKRTPNETEMLNIIPLTTIRGIYRDKKTAEPRFYIQQIPGEADRMIDPAGVVHWRWGMDSSEEGGFGIGLIRPLIETRKFTLRYEDGKEETITVPPFLQMKALIENELPYAVKRWAHFKVLYSPKAGEKFPKDWAKTHQEALTGLEDAVTEVPVETTPVPLNVSRGFEPLLDYIENRFFEGCQNPVGRLFTSPGFTEASARIALLLGDRKVSALQRQIKRQTEREIFWPILQQMKYDPKEVEARLTWKPRDKLDIRIRDLLDALFPQQPIGPEKAPYAPGITLEEFRNNLAKLTGIELEEALPETPKSLPQPAPTEQEKEKIKIE